MAFFSLPFLVLVITGLILYYALPGRFQWIWLLLVSYAFYLYGDGRAVVWLVAVTGATWLATLCIGALVTRHKSLPAEQKKAHAAQHKRQKKAVCALYLFAVFGLLYIMKYWNFTAELFSSVSLPRFDFLIPLGLSFFIFQSAGYVIDVYRGKYAPERNPFKVALFTSFFPQMVQGPISRFHDLAPQLYATRKLDYTNLQYGIQLAMWGYLKKLVIADRAAIVVNAVFADSAAYGGAVAAAAVFLYCIQLYCDFSGGIDITRGVAQMFGITLAENFQRPFFAVSLADYWRRWHITLGSWMRDYLFYPLSLSKPFVKLGKWGRKHLKGKVSKILPTSLATFVVYLVIGIWHGANFRYIVFGLWNGTLITASLLLEGTFYNMRGSLGIRDESRPWHLFQVLRTFLLVFIGRYITRAPRLKTAISMLITTVTDVRLHELRDGTFASLGLTKGALAVVLIGMLLVLCVEWYQERGGRVRDSLAAQHGFVQWLAIAVPLVILLLLGIMRDGYISSEFIYKQF